jgi:hypothetical protein
MKGMKDMKGRRQKRIFGSDTKPIVKVFGDNHVA